MEKTHKKIIVTVIGLIAIFSIASVAIWITNDGLMREKITEEIRITDYTVFITHDNLISEKYGTLYEVVVFCDFDFSGKDYGLLYISGWNCFYFDDKKEAEEFDDFCNQHIDERVILEYYPVVKSDNTGYVIHPTEFISYEVKT